MPTPTQREVSELAYSEKRSAKLLESAEKALAFEKEEVTRLYSSLQVHWCFFLSFCEFIDINVKRTKRDTNQKIGGRPPALMSGMPA